MKKENEKKSIVKSIKLSQNQYDCVQEQAKSRGMNFSEYMIDCAIHKQNNITPQIAVKAQEIVNAACDIRELMAECERNSRLEKDIDTIMEGADALWVYLK